MKADSTENYSWSVTVGIGVRNSLRMDRGLGCNLLSMLPLYMVVCVLITTVVRGKYIF